MANKSFIKFNNIKLFINLYLNENKSIPSEVMEAFTNANIAIKSTKFAECEMVIVVNKNDKKKVEKIISEFGRFNITELKSSHQFPMINDIFESGKRYCNSDDYLCYINSDINLQYWFFDFVVDSLLIEPIDAGLVINRKDIVSDKKNVFKKNSNSESYYHPGLDCMVFPFKILNKMSFGSCTIGMPPVGNLIVTNMLQLLPRVKLINDALITWHRGKKEDSKWKSIENKKVIEQNYLNAFAALDNLFIINPDLSLSNMRIFPQMKKFFEKYVKYRNS